MSLSDLFNSPNWGKVSVNEREAGESIDKKSIWKLYGPDEHKELIDFINEMSIPHGTLTMDIHANDDAVVINNHGEYIATVPKREGYSIKLPVHMPGVYKWDDLDELNCRKLFSKNVFRYDETLERFKKMANSDTINIFKIQRWVEAIKWHDKFHLVNETVPDETYAYPNLLLGHSGGGTYKRMYHDTKVGLVHRLKWTPLMYMDPGYFEFMGVDPNFTVCSKKK